MIVPDARDFLLLTPLWCGAFDLMPVRSGDETVEPEQRFPPALEPENESLFGSLSEGGFFPMRSR